VSLPPSVGLLWKNLLFEDDRTKKSGKKVGACRRAIRRDNAVPVLETGVCMYAWKNMFAVGNKILLGAPWCFDMDSNTWVFLETRLRGFAPWTTATSREWLAFLSSIGRFNRVIVNSLAYNYNSAYAERNAKVSWHLCTLRKLAIFLEKYYVRVYAKYREKYDSQRNINAMMNLLAGGKRTNVDVKLENWIATKITYCYTYGVQ